MSSPARAPGSATGLRERKKARTRVAIQAHALRLFAEQGYDVTTVEQIASAAEVSPSTFFRYFPTKEDLLLYDDYDPVVAEAFRRQPADLAPLAALRAAFREVIASVSETEHDQVLFRTRLAMSVPAARARALENMLAAADVLGEALAERTGADPRGIAVRTFTNAVVGAMLPSLFIWLESDGAEPVGPLVDRCLALLEAGLPV